MMDKDEYARSLADDWSADMDLYAAVAWPVIQKKLGIDAIEPAIFMAGFVAWKLDQIWTDLPNFAGQFAGMEIEQIDTLVCAICSTSWHALIGVDEAIEVACPSCGHLNELRA